MLAGIRNYRTGLRIEDTLDRQLAAVQAFEGEVIRPGDLEDAPRELPPTSS